MASDSSSEIYNVRGNYWHSGPDFDDNFDEAASVQLYDTFALVAGEDNYKEDPIDTVYVFDHINYQWILMESKLMTARESFPGAIAVPDDFYQC